MSTSDFDAFSLPESHVELRRSLRPFVDDCVTPFAASVDEESRFPIEAYREMSQADFHAPHIPEQYGGAGADALATCIVIEEIARGCASSSLIPAVNKLGTLPLLMAGSEEQCERYLRPTARGDALFSYALSEREAGSDVASMRCRAKRRGDGFVLNGHKAWISNASESKFFTVFAVSDADAPRGSGISAFIVERSDPGFSVGSPERKMGIKGSPTCELHFEDCWIPGNRMIGSPGEGMKLALKTLDHTRITIGAQAVGIAQAALDVASTYVRDRQQFGKTLDQFQGVQFMLAEMAMSITAARNLVYVAAAKSERDEEDLAFYGAAAKCFASDAAMRVTTDAVQLMGGSGYVRDFPVERMMRDAKITQIYEGTNQIQRVVMAKHLLRDGIS